MKMSEILKARRAALVAERTALLDVEADAFSPESEARCTAINTEIADLDARTAEAVEAEHRDEVARAAESRRVPDGTVEVPGGQVRVGTEANPIYRKGEPGGHSYFGDLAASQRGDRAAIQRLADSQERALVSSSATAGGSFAPPLWLVDEFIELARAARITADLVHGETLPGGVSSVNLPKVSTGTAVGITQTQATAITQTDMATTSVSSGITTISGGQKVSLELINQSGVAIDNVVLADLALAYASSLDSQVLNGSGANGQLKGLVTAGTTVTFTTTAPAVVSATATANFYGKVMGGISAMAGSRLLGPDAIVMHPRRWAWIMNALDTQTRPLVVPNGQAFNPVGTGGVAAQGPAGTLAGLPVYLDANIATNLGAATNQDQVFILRRDDHWLFESPVEAASFDATYAADNSIFFRVLGFAAFVTRHSASAQVIDGTGLVAPTF